MLAKRSALALALALVGASLVVPQRGLAQPQPPAVNAKAATGEELNTYLGMAAINMCTLSQTKVAFNPAMQSNLNMLVTVLASKHGSLVPGAQSPLTREQLANGSVAQLVLRVDSLCGKTLPADWKKEFDPLLSQVKQALQSAGQPPKK
ncbi:MAG: hypothetical protein VKO39_03170 [Cyanobacteriota bacterium]|nr:hypothetical protein [Cyanobacteriota bacterium]